MEMTISLMSIGLICVKLIVKLAVPSLPIVCLVYGLASIVMQLRHRLPRGRRGLALPAVCVAFGVAAVSAFVYYVMPFSPVGEPLVVDRQVVDGTIELMVTQTFSGTNEPYNVAFGFREQGSEWTWSTLDFQALYWRGRILVDETKREATIMNGRRIEGKFNWDTKEMIWPSGKHQVLVPVEPEIP